ncbi:MAG: ABC transporter permease [Lachnospiraceae bacterium]|nr:ABC transporter permease [Lachnospiraceae bacterium]
MDNKKKQSRIPAGSLWTLPSAGLLLCLTLIPLFMLLIFSFMNRNLFAGQPWPGWTMKNITRMMKSATYWKLMRKSLIMASTVTLICIAGSYPASWAIAKIIKPKNRSLFMMLVILPFFTSQLLLIYAMMNLIQSGGLLLTVLDAVGIHGVKTWLYTDKATILILTYEYIPYMILCLYSSLEGISDNLIQASHILGAGKVRTFLNIVFPMSVPGLLSGILLVFVPVAGSFMEPGLVGGAKGSMVGSMIDTQYSTSLNMGFGAALSCMLLIILSIIMAAVRFAASRAQRAIGGDAS